VSLYTRITGTSGFLPEKVLTNQDMEAILDTSDAWIRERTGIRKRHIVAEGERCSRLAEVVARRALEDAGIDPARIDLILVAPLRRTSSPPAPHVCCNGASVSMAAVPSTCRRHVRASSMPSG